MKKLVAIGFLMVFSMAFVVGVIATPAQAGPAPPYPAPDNCWWECQNSAWTLCCENIYGFVRCFHEYPPYYCFGG